MNNKSVDIIFTICILLLIAGIACYIGIPYINFSKRKIIYTKEETLPGEYSAHEYNKENCTFIQYATLYWKSFTNSNIILTNQYIINNDQDF